MDGASVSSTGAPRAQITFIYQQHRCDHHNSSSPTEQDMEGECVCVGGGRKAEKGEIVKRAIAAALQ